MQDKKIVKLSVVRDIMAFASSIPAHKAMGFRADSQIAKLASKAKDLINYEIGDELTEIINQRNDERETVRKSFFEEYKTLSENEQVEREAEFNTKIKDKLRDSTVLAELIEKEAALWEKEVELALPVVSIEEREYAEGFKEPKVVQVFDNSFRLDGWESLLTLMSMDLIVIKEA